MKLSANFSRHEFKCKGVSCCCTCDSVDAELLTVLQDLRDHFNSPVIINSAHRCFTHNKNEGGSPNSYHLSGRAADINVKGIEPLMVQNYLERKYPDRYGIGHYKGFTHIDTRTGKGRWHG